MTQTTPSANAPTFDSLIADAVALGQLSGDAADIQVKFLVKAAEAAYLGTLNLATSKHGEGVDDAGKLAEAYVMARGKRVLFDAKAPNQRKLASNVRKAIKIGGTPKWGVGQPMQTINEMLTLRLTLKKDPANKGRLDDAANCFMRFATAQLKRDQLMTQEEYKTYCFKRDPDPRTASEVLEAVRTLMNKLKIGKVANCPDLDNSPEVQAIINSCTKRLVAISKNGGSTSQAA